MMLSRTYRPSPDLAPYVRRFYVFEAELPDELVIEDFLLSETAFIRVLIKGDWSGEVAPQQWSRPGRALFFGANALPFKVRVKGSFSVTGAALRPSGWRALFHASHQEYADRLLRLDEVWHAPTGPLEDAMDNAADDAGKIANRYQWDAVMSDGDMSKAGVGGQGVDISPKKDMVVAWFCTGDGNDQEETMARAIVRGIGSAK